MLAFRTVHSAQARVLLAQAVELKQRKMSKEANPEALPAARSIPTECFAGLPPVPAGSPPPAFSTGISTLRRGSIVVCLLV